jgi:hypothetical protein
MTSLKALFADGKKPDDWLSPILIKELRQGMRARAFVLSFLLLQLFLIVLVLGNVAAQYDRTTLDFQNSFFWIIIGFALLLLMPLRGLNAISQEVRRNTIETIMLTRLTSWRIVFGKWSALFAQSLLFTSAVLPYIVLRYFIGGNDVISDFRALLILLWFSGILIAAGIAASALTNVIVRIILVLVGLWLLALSDSGIFPSGFGRGEAWEIFGWLLIFGFFIPVFLLELTASSIAPVSENHALRRRILALLFFTLGSVLSWLAQDSDGLETYLPLVICIGICYFELSEKARLLPRFILPMSRMSPLGKIMGTFFLPGWPSGLLFSLVFIPLAVFLKYATLPDHASTPSLTLPLTIYAIFGSVLLPILICHLFWARMKQVFLMIVLYNIVIIGVASVLQGFASLMGAPIDRVLAFVPSLPVLLINLREASSKPDLRTYFVGNSIVLTAVILILYMASRPYFRDLIALFGSIGRPKLSPDSPKPETLTS